jgi:hypothetical protein
MVCRLQKDSRRGDQAGLGKVTIMKRAVIKAAVSVVVAALIHSTTFAGNLNETPQTPAPQCPLNFPVDPVTVAPNQPEVPTRSTVGIINALCEVTLNFVGCGFIPTSIVLTCDSNGDGVAELVVPLKNIVALNGNLVRATLAPLSEQLPGTPFPLACCGGQVNITLSRTVTSGDDNVFGTFTQSVTCPVDLGQRAPVVISVSPSDGDCAVGQNLFVPGSCFIQPDGKPNVTRVFAVERGNSNNVVEATRFVILNPNLIDAFFEFGAASAGKTFLIFATGPNGTSRNLTALPAGAPAACPTGNEQGIQVSFTCRSGSTGGGSPTPQPPVIVACRLERSPSGSFSLSVFGLGAIFKTGASVTVGGIAPKKVQLKDPGPDPNTFGRLVLKGKICKALPGIITVINPGGAALAPFQCNQSCAAQ